GGAGIVADIKAIEAHRCWAAAVATTLTVQTVGRVDAAHEVPPEILVAQIGAVFSDHPVAAVKVGLLGGAATVDAVANALRGRGLPVVLDPVCCATSGARFLDDAARDRLRGALLPLVDVVTPNRDEVLWLAGLPPEAEIEAAAEALLEDGARHVLVTGASAANGVYEDRLFSRQGIQAIEHREVATDRIHGTGCLHSSS
ncbi:MAG: bifunctional hydroxymethylpyrimidine kinase/phosphomethylpyrimidine kinase, partial [Actinobacteria bacterium]|nr:bifunctional hydroxymethylpyrimidine kinase/phosphomethylpyrimidine kinase [Actinomycetota bacterium]NIU71844.1 bifunctional hydroxymethylpyrimidine kinase/phosphomethylpyrimidine kinase [Actinomycetota bacterium]NIV59575.1 bifunctional hydroxymethylpyrimidine kinase/phosphomethylpyrimidine kinase [Actinomycetota bacterium]NIW33790.1 bifunctional hydroxymethylpyrimidine kinase/phosphomethylpyrimidine kinase [Actinomycetota bacterium]